MAVFILRAMYGAEYVPPPASGTVFTDVKTTHWAAPWIEQLAAEGITKGCGKGLYCPESSVTRAQMAVFLERLMRGADFIPNSYILAFDDIKGHWAADWIQALYNDHAAVSCGVNNFCPDLNITRGKIAEFLLRSKFGLGYTPQAPSGIDV